MKPASLINLATFQAGWFACVMGAANGYPWFGPLVITGIVLLHLKLWERPADELRLLLVAAVMGFTFDTALVRTGWLEYPNGMMVAGTAPYWIVAMWLNFTTTLNLSLRWLHGRPLLAAVLGATGGPLTYLAGARLGGLSFVDQPAALATLAVGWGLVTPLLVSMAQRLDGTTQPVAQHA